MNHFPTILLALILFTGCSLTKDERRLNRGTKKLEKLVSKFPELKRIDTLRIPHQILVPRTQLDTVATLTTDTITITKDRLTVRFRVDTVLKTVWMDAMCDTLVIRDTIRVPVSTIQPVKVVPSSKTGNRWLPWLLLVFVAVVLILSLLRR